MGKSKQKITSWSEHNPLRRKVHSVSGDGAYDTKKCHEVLRKKNCKPIIPLKKAGYWEKGHPRNEAVETLKNDTLAQRKTDNNSIN